MAKNETKRLNHFIMSEDEAAFHALQNINGYSPTNPAYSISALTQAFTDMRTAQIAEDQAEAALASAQDTAISKEWAVHNLMLNVKDQVRAQFGKDSLQLQEIGLKRRSDYKTRKPKTPSPSKPDSKPNSEVRI